MLSSALIRAQIEEKLPAAFTAYRRAELGSIPTGIAAVDTVVQGVPLHALTEICGSNLASSGKTSVLTSLLVQASQEHFCVLVDATDSFDPRSAQTAGVNLKHLLWIRCGGRSMKSLEQAFKAADLLLQGSSGGFGLIVVDLVGISERFVRRIPLTTWFRFSRVIERLPAALVFVMPCPAIGTCANLTLVLSGAQIRWSKPAPASPAHACLSATLDFQVEIRVRRSCKKPPQSDRSFSAQRRWA
jgi:recombination protein RecA